MSIEGRVSVDIVFHDKSVESNAIKVIEIEGTESMSSGKVAYIKGTVGTQQQTLQINNTGYRNADGAVVGFSQVTRIGLRASREMKLADNQENTIICSCDDHVAFSQINTGSNLKIKPQYTSGTASYTVFLYGT